MVPDLEAGSAGDLGYRALQPGVLKRQDLPALVADHVVVVLAAGIGALVPGGLRPQIELVHETEVGQLLERAVDARASYAPTAGAKALVDVEGGERARLGGQDLDHGTPRAAAPEAGGLEPGERVLGPVRAGDGVLGVGVGLGGQLGAMVGTGLGRFSGLESNGDAASAATQISTVAPAIDAPAASSKWNDA